MLTTETKSLTYELGREQSPTTPEPWLKYFHLIYPVLLPLGSMLQLDNIFATPTSPTFFDPSIDLYKAIEKFDTALLQLVAYCVRYNIRNEEQTTELKESISLIASFFINPSEKLLDQQIVQINRSLKYLKSRFDFFQKIILTKLTSGDSDLSIIMSVDVYNTDIVINNNVTAQQISIDPNNQETLGIDIITLGQIAENLFEPSYSQDSFKKMRDELILHFKNLIAMYSNLKKLPQKEEF